MEISCAPLLDLGIDVTVALAVRQTGWLIAGSRTALRRGGVRGIAARLHLNRLEIRLILLAQQGNAFPYIPHNI